jgi:hypothetical protein
VRRVHHLLSSQSSEGDTAFERGSSDAVSETVFEARAERTEEERDLKRGSALGREKLTSRSVDTLKRHGGQEAVACSGRAARFFSGRERWRGCPNRKRGAALEGERHHQEGESPEEVKPRRASAFRETKPLTVVNELRRRATP